MKWYEFNPQRNKRIRQKIVNPRIAMKTFSPLARQRVDFGASINQQRINSFKEKIKKIM